MSALAERVLSWFVAPATDDGPPVADVVPGSRADHAHDHHRGLGPPRRRARHRPAPAAVRAWAAAPAVAVLGGDEVVAFAAPLAAALARRWRAPAGIVCCGPAVGAVAAAGPGTPVVAGQPGVVVAAASWATGRTEADGVAAAGARRHGTRAAPPVAALSTPAARRLACALLDRGHAATAAGRVARVVLVGDELAAAAEHERVAAAGRGAPVVLALSGPRGDGFEAVLAAHDLLVLATPPGADPRIADLARAALAARLPAVPTVTVAVPGSPLAARRPRTAISAVLGALR